MNASEIQSEVVKTEDRIASDVAGIISRHINELTDKTGLSFQGVEFGWVDVTCVEDHGQRIQLSRASLDMALPPRVRG